MLNRNIIWFKNSAELATKRELLLHHIALPMILFIIAVAILEKTNADLAFADWLYQLEGQQWSLKDHFITSTLLHDSAQDFSRIIALSLLIIALISPYNKHLATYRKGWWYLFLSLAGAAAFVSISKYYSHLQCPWNLERYGGMRPYVSLFESLPKYVEAGQCFPAGHASGGYGLLSLYFFFHHYQPRKKWLGLAIGISMGLIYGFAQQLRGAHFLSHDLWTLAICWSVAVFFYWLMFTRRHASQLS